MEKEREREWEREIKRERGGSVRYFTSLMNIYLGVGVGGGVYK